MFSSLLLWAGIFSFFSLSISEPKRLNSSPAHRRLAVMITSFSWNQQVLFLSKQGKFFQISSGCFWNYWLANNFFSLGNQTLLHMWPRMYKLQSCLFRRFSVYQWYWASYMIVGEGLLEAWAPPVEWFGISTVGETLNLNWVRVGWVLFASLKCLWYLLW